MPDLGSFLFSFYLGTRQGAEIPLPVCRALGFCLNGSGSGGGAVGTFMDPMTTGLSSTKLPSFACLWVMIQLAMVQRDSGLSAPIVMVG